MHVQKIGCRWQECPREYGPHKTIYNRFARWSAGAAIGDQLEPAARNAAAFHNRPRAAEAAGLVASDVDPQFAPPMPGFDRLVGDRTGLYDAGDARHRLAGVAGDPRRLGERPARPRLDARHGHDRLRDRRAVDRIDEGLFSAPRAAAAR